MASPNPQAATERPVIFALDDDAEVVRAVARDLRQRYADRYRIVTADQPRAALEMVRTLKSRNTTVALFLVDQRMPELDGLAFLREVDAFYPQAKRALLTAYADTEAAIRAINEVRLNYYLMKPWHPPEQNFYPVLDDLLEDWRAGHRPEFAGVRLVDHRWSAIGHHLRDFMARNQIPYRFLDIESVPEARELAGAEPDLPLAVYPDGTRAVRPEPAAIAAKMGLATAAANPFYDLLIVGGGPAGLAAAVYGASEGLKCAIVERDAPGGQAGTSSRIENYLGFPSGVSGGDLSRRAVTQARRFGADMVLTQSVVGLKLDGPYKTVQLSDGSALSAHAMLVASGVQYRRLGFENVDALTGAGVFYGAAMTEAEGCGGRIVYIVGGGNSAGQGAMFLSRYAKSVTILVRRPDLVESMSQYLIDQIAATPNIRVQGCTEIAALRGATQLEGLDLRDARSGAIETVSAEALFIYIGASPATDWLDGAVQRDSRGFVLSGPDLARDAKGRVAGWPLDRDPFLLETNVPGLFVAGDVRANSMKRVAAAVGEGSIAVSFVHQYLAER